MLQEKVKTINSHWSFDDYKGALFGRLFNFYRSNYKTAPGLYSLNSPNKDSHVIVTCNYTLTFNHVRRALEGRSGWVLVLDTKGINVWCAAGKGSFGTNELLKQILLTNLHEVVNHRVLILPQLGAANMKAHEIQKKSGFTVKYGPVRSSDLVNYIDNGNKATNEMRTVKFSFIDRLILTPIEITISAKHILLTILVIFLLFGCKGSSSIFIVPILVGWIAGTFLSPLLLPLLPFRSFAGNGFLVGAILTAPLFMIINKLFNFDYLSLIFTLLTVPVLSSWFYLNFTGSTTFTNPSGVRKEMKATIPIYLTAAALLTIIIIISVIIKWRG